MIKFHCSGCQKKIGVPENYAGKMVRCPQCKEPAKVPVPAPPAQVAQPVAAASQENELIWTDDLLKIAQQSPAAVVPVGAAAGPAVRGVRVHGPTVTCPRCTSKVSADSEFCINCGAPLPAKSGKGRKAVKSGSSSEGGGFLSGLKQFASFPVALGAGLGMAVLGGMLWAWLVCVTEFQFGFVAWLIGACVGGAMVVFSKEQTVGLGVLASILALFSILIGKYYIAKWYVLPQMQDMIVVNIIENNEMMFDQLTEHLIAQGEMTEELNDNISAVRMAEALDSEMPENLTSDDVTSIKSEIENIERQVKTMKEPERRAIVEENLERGMGQIGEEGVAALKSIGIFIGFFAAFGLFDILWILFAVTTAYKVVRFGC